MGIAYNPRIVTDGLVLALDAGNTKSYLGSGATWTDLSGNGNNGTLVNGVGYNSNNGGSLSFDGTNDYVSNTSLSININSGASASYWIKSTNPTEYTFILSNNYSNNSRFYFAQSFDVSGKYRFGLGTSIIDTQISILNNQWQYVSCVVENGNYTFYSNGIFSSSGTYVQSANPVNEYYLGRYFGGTGYDYQGNIAQVSIYNKALTASEVQQNFNATRSRYGI